MKVPFLTYYNLEFHHCVLVSNLVLQIVQKNLLNNYTKKCKYQFAMNDFLIFRYKIT